MFLSQDRSVFNYEKQSYWFSSVVVTFYQTVRILMAIISSAKADNLSNFSHLFGSTVELHCEFNLQNFNDKRC